MLKSQCPNNGNNVPRGEKTHDAEAVTPEDEIAVGEAARSSRRSVRPRWASFDRISLEISGSFQISLDLGLMSAYSLKLLGNSLVSFAR